MRVLKIVAEGLVTSFRYPHFVQGVHPTFDMPPPATIYGHVCSAVGEHIPPNSTRFAYHFTFDAKFFDYEHLHFFGKEPKMNPFRRELLFRPRLTLYLDNTDLEPYFRRPRYPVILGRAQDLMTYTDIHLVELQETDRAFFTGTLIPLARAAEIEGRSFAVTMPRFIDEYRQPQWGQYAMLPDSPNPPAHPSDGGLSFADNPLPIWVDPEQDAAHSSRPGLQRGVIWHEW